MLGGSILRFLSPLAAPQETTPTVSSQTQQFLSSTINALEPLLSSLWSKVSRPFNLRDMMDAMFSIPLLSFLLVPALSSYSTSLNLLFFYMTWATLVLSHPPLRVEIFGTAAVRLLFYLFPSLLFFLFDVLAPSAALVFKAQGETGLPAGSRRGRTGRREAKVVGWAVVNLVLSVAVQGAVEYVLTRVAGARSALRVSIKLPMPWEVAKDLVRGLLGREVGRSILCFCSIVPRRRGRSYRIRWLKFRVSVSMTYAYVQLQILSYFIHRYSLHSRDSFVGRYHRRWYHSLRAPYPLTAHYDHPAAYMLSRFIPTYGPAMLFRFHMLTYILYLAIISIEETFTYSGYKIMPTNFFLGGIARRVDMHVLSCGEGNYGPWGILDWICGTAVAERSTTSVEDSSDLQDEEEMEEYEIDEKVRRAIEASVRRRLREKEGKGKSSASSSRRGRSS
ncbi:sterol desaturase family [Thermoascus aurantiacus ATCC 26904]